MISGDLDSYWKNTSAFDTINTYITLNFEGLKEDVLTMLEGGRVSVNVNTFKNDLSVIGSKDEALTALIHLGYLGYDGTRKVAYIPNYEVGLAYQAAPAYYNVVREFPSGVGFADMVLIPRANAGECPAIVIELKWDKGADTAIRQIKERRYTGSLKGYGDKILLVGINYDKNSENKKHQCVIEE